MPLCPPFWRPFSKKMAAFFSKVIRVIFENMREIIVTLVSTYNIFREYYSDSILLRASHNGGLNLAGCCGNLFSIILDIKMLRAVESASAFSLLTNIENEINGSNPFIFTEPCQYSSLESDMC